MSEVQNVEKISVAKYLKAIELGGELVIDRKVILTL
jgi:hypothetical protein